MAFDTTQPAQVQGLSGYVVDPLVTIGDTITGTTGALNATTAGNYTPVGILDGIGAYELNAGTVRVFVNHELSSTLGYAYSLANGTMLTGARVSYFDIDKASLEVVDAGLAFDTIYNRAGEVVDAASDLEFNGLQRFCSANLVTPYQFGAGRGFVDTIFFTGEETDGGTEFALDAANGDLWALPWLGRAAWESVTELDTGTTDKVALLVGDDRDPAPLLLYVGTKGVDYNNNGTIDFLERNGLTGGKLYVWVADDPTDGSDSIEANPEEFRGTGNSTKGQFVEIDIYDEGTQTFATQSAQDALVAAVNGFLFSRPEDVATNPNDGTQALIASTGRTGLFNDVDTWGTTYVLDVDFANIGSGPIAADLNIIYDGDDSGNGAVAGPDYGLRSHDNNEWADDGLIYAQEDRAISSSLFGATSGEEASIWAINPDAAPETLTRVAQIDRSGVPSGQTDSNPTDLGNWETSGIVDVSELFGKEAGELLLFDVQAHSLVDGVISSSSLVQGGQLAFLIAPDKDVATGSGSSNNDTVFANGSGVGVSGFDGVNDNLFTGEGDDTVNFTAAATVLTGNNVVHAGSGGDEIYVSRRDKVFGSTGDDLFFATDGLGKNTMSGGAGNDQFFLADLDQAGDTAMGGAGNDQFFVGNGGGNYLSGGAGSDIFQITNGSILPASANWILDFQVGLDKIQINISAGVSDFNDTDLVRSGNDILIGTTTIATLTGVNTTTLTAADFSFV